MEIDMDLEWRQVAKSIGSTFQREYLTTILGAYSQLKNIKYDLNRVRCDWPYRTPKPGPLSHFLQPSAHTDTFFVRMTAIIQSLL
jgi:hypothetical protein